MGEYPDTPDQPVQVDISVMPGLRAHSGRVTQSECGNPAEVMLGQISELCVVGRLGFVHVLHETTRGTDIE